MPARRKVRPAGAAARRAALRWWLLSLAAAGATVTAAAALLAVALHVSGLAAPSAASSGAPYRLSQPREIEELRWEQEFAPPQLASPRKVIDSPTDAVLLLVAAAVAFFVLSFLNSREPMTPGLISRFDSWTAWRTTRRGRGCGCRRRRGGSCPAWRRHRSTEVSALLPY